MVFIWCNYSPLNTHKAQHQLTHQMLMSHISEKIKELDIRLKGLDHNLTVEQDPEWVLSERMRIIRHSMGVVTVLRFGVVPFESTDKLIAELSAGDMWKSKVIRRIREGSKKSKSIITH